MKKLSFLFTLLFATTALFAQGYKVGDIAADFSLKNVDGKMVSLSDYKKEKGVVVIFTCNHCPYSVAYEDRIIELDAAYKEKGYPVIAINPNDPDLYPADSYEAMQERAQEKGFTFPYLFDDGQSVYPAYGATKTPHVYVLKNEKGKFKVAYIGAIDNSAKDAAQVSETYLSDALDALLAGKAPLVSETKAVGCGIKAKQQ